MIPFAKLQGAGNGYVVADGRGLDVDWSRLAETMTDPHFGMGSDGLAIVCDSEVAPVRMRILNSDGSESEMSGNGIRLFAKFVLDRGLAQLEDGVLRVETGGGVRCVAPTFGPRGMEQARVLMGEPTLRPSAVPVDPAVFRGSSDAVDDEPIIDQPLDVAGRVVRVTCLAIGNPHAVAIIDQPVDDFPLTVVGPGVMSHEAFPNRINFEVVNVLDRATIRARIFERGEGETLASGTGSTASVIAAHLRGLVDDRVRVLLPGGVLGVRWDGVGEAELEGPAVEVFSGTWPGDATR